MVKTQKSPSEASNIDPDLKKYIDTIMSKLSAEIKSGFAENKSRFDKIEKHMGEINKNISDLSDKLAKSDLRVIELTNRVEFLEEALSITNEKLEGHIRSKNLVMNNIPYNEKEDLSAIVSSISAKLGYEGIPARRYYRFKPSQLTSQTKSSPPIMLQFETEVEKQDFFFKYLKIASKLTQESLNLKGTARVYIQDHLTPIQHNINKEALKLRKENRISHVRVNKGLVFVRVTQHSKPSPVASVAALYNLIGNI